MEGEERCVQKAMLPMGAYPTSLSLSLSGWHYIKSFERRKKDSDEHSNAITNQGPITIRMDGLLLFFVCLTYSLPNCPSCARSCSFHVERKTQQ